MGRGVVRTNDRIIRKEKIHLWELLSEVVVRLTTASALEETTVHIYYFKIAIVKYFAILTSKHLCWSLFLINLQVVRLKRDCNTVSFLWILQSFFLKFAKFLLLTSATLIRLVAALILISYLKENCSEIHFKTYVARTELRFPLVCLFRRRLHKMVLLPVWLGSLCILYFFFCFLFFERSSQSFTVSSS